MLSKTLAICCNISNFHNSKISSKKMEKKQETLKSRMYEFINKNPNLPKISIVAHFEAEGVPRPTIYALIRCYEQNEPVGRKKGSGRRPKIATKHTIHKLKKMFNNKSGCSQRRAARNIGCSQRYIGMMLKDSAHIKKRKKEKIPKRTLQQKEAARPKCRQISETYRGFDFILDDESYFTLSNSSLAGNDIYYTDNIENVPENVRYKKQAKFEKKVLVWLAISPRGMSEAFFVPSGLAINQHVYREECLQKRLLKFVRAHHAEGQFVFWPDLASSHYAKSVQVWLDEQNIDFVPKWMNPANLPEVRPIEDFWAYLKRLVYAENYEAKNEEDLIKRIKKCLKNIDLSFVHKLAAGTWTRVDRVRREGIRA